MRTMHHTDPALVDTELAAEVELVMDLMCAIGERKTRPTQGEIDRLLGL